MRWFDYIDALVETFYETDTSIDITRPRTFATMACIAILLGIFIGVGYYIVFTSQDCHYIESGKIVCFPNIYSNYKLQIGIVTVLAGVVAGLSPFIFKYIRNERERDDFNDAV